MSLAYVQSAGTGPETGSTTMTVTLTNTPTPGNVLVGAMTFGQAGVTRTGTPPAGTWTQVDNQTQSLDTLVCWTHIVQGGDGKSWTFTVSDSGDYSAAAVVEITGASMSSPIDVSAHLLVGTQNTSQVSASATPDVAGTLPVGILHTDSFLTGPPTVTSGWTEQISQWNNYHTLLIATKNTLTTDTTTAQQVTWTLSYGISGGQAVSFMLLMRPAVSVLAPLMWISGG